MDDRLYLTVAVLCAIGLLPGFVAGWLVRSWLYGCAGLLVLLVSAIGMLIGFAIYYVDPSQSEGWAGLAIIFLLFIIIIVWLAAVVGWILARSIQSAREESRQVPSNFK